MTFIIKSISFLVRGGGGVAGVRHGQPLANEALGNSHTHTRTDTDMLLSLRADLGPATSRPRSPLMNASVAFKVESFCSCETDST